MDLGFCLAMRWWKLQMSLGLVADSIQPRNHVSTKGETLPDELQIRIIKKFSSSRHFLIT